MGVEIGFTPKDKDIDWRC